MNTPLFSLSCMSRRRALSELPQKLLMAFQRHTGAPIGGARSRNPSALRAAASLFATRALESSSSTPCWPPSPLSAALPPARRRPRLPFDRTQNHAGSLFVTSISILSRSFHPHRARRSLSAAATSIDAAAASSTDANDDDDSDESLDSFLAPPSVTFASLGLDSQVCDALRAAGIAHPSAVQVER